MANNNQGGKAPGGKASVAAAKAHAKGEANRRAANHQRRTLNQVVPALVGLMVPTAA